MKKLLAIVLSAVMVFSMASAVMAAEAPEGYTLVEVFPGTYGFGDAEITAYTNDDFSEFYLFYEAFDEDQILYGTVEDGIVNVEYDETGFMTGDAQLIWDDAMAAAAWDAIGEAVAEAAVEEAIEEEVAPDSDFVWNGQKEVWAILPVSGVPGLMVHADTMGYLMEEEGWTYVVKSADGNPGNQVQFVEDAIAAGNVGALMIAAMDVAMLEDVCIQAKDAGIAVNMLGVTPDYPLASFVATEYALTGMFAVMAAENWAQQRAAEGGDIPVNADGKFEVAVDYYTDIIDGIYRSNAIFGTIEASDDLVAVSATQAYGDAAYTDAYDNAQTALAAHPDCRIFVCYEPDEAMGIAAAIEDYANQNGLDLADFGVFPCYSMDDTFLTMVAEVAEDHSANAVKGYATYGGSIPDDELAAYDEAFHAVDKYKDDMTFSVTGLQLATELLGSTGSENYEWTYGVGYFDDITAWNVYGFEIRWTNGDEDPAEIYRVDQFQY